MSSTQRYYHVLWQHTALSHYSFACVSLLVVINCCRVKGFYYFELENSKKLDTLVQQPFPYQIRETAFFFLAFFVISVGSISLSLSFPKHLPFFSGFLDITLSLLCILTDSVSLVRSVVCRLLPSVSCVWYNWQRPLSLPEKKVQCGRQRKVSEGKGQKMYISHA